MLPLYLLNSAKGQPILVELKTGETYNGKLVACDNWMNLTLNEVIFSSADGKEFMKLPETYLRGSCVKYMRLPNEIMDNARAQILEQQRHNNNRRYEKNNNNSNNNNRRNRNNNNNNNNNNRNNNNNNNNRNWNRRREAPEY